MKTNTDKVQTALSEKIQLNKQETKQELDNVALKLEESFNELSGKLVSFMVQTMVAIYDALDKKNADKVYNILAKESIQCFRLYKPVSDWLEMLPLDSTGLNM